MSLNGMDIEQCMDLKENEESEENKDCDLVGTHESLDPTDWDAFSAIAHRMLDMAIDSHKNIREQSVWQPMDQKAEDALDVPVPTEGKPLAEVCDTFMQHVWPNMIGNTHPRFLGWVCGTGTPSGFLADMMAAAANPLVGCFNDASTRVETQVVDWAKSLMGFPEDASGFVTTGGSIANLIGLHAARDAWFSRQDPTLLGKGPNAKPWNVAADGMAGWGPLLRFYASEEIHNSVAKALSTLGLGRASLRLVKTLPSGQVDIQAMQNMIAYDRSQSLCPVGVIGACGTVNTGACDDLVALADICAQEKLWLHVDGAFGALAKLSPKTAHLTAGLERADSVAFDFHKWLHVPYEAGCVLVRVGGELRQPYSVPAAYLEPLSRGVSAWSDPSSGRGPQLSRSFKALKVWFALQEFGVARLGAHIARNVDQAHDLAASIDAHPRFERVAPVALHIVCFRWAAPDMADASLDAINQEALMLLQESGFAVVSGTRWRGQFVFRLAISNHRTQSDDLAAVLEKIDMLAQNAVQSMSACTDKAWVTPTCADEVSPAMTLEPLHQAPKERINLQR